MYINSSYKNNSVLDFKDKSKPLVVGSCGTYRLSSHPRLPTYRPRGRLDFQIIYIASGRAHFHFGSPENETIVAAGNIVLFRPKEFQKYEYYGIDKTEVYWVHFTGSDVKNILRKYGFPDDRRVFPVGTSLLVLLLRHLLITFHRELGKEHTPKNEYLDHEMAAAVSYFNENYNQDINIEEYAASRGMSVSWFIRNFKKYTGTTPMQFVTSIRITNAQLLLETTNYAVNEIARSVGYENPLYFSRLFREQKGCPPSHYRKRT